MPWLPIYSEAIEKYTFSPEDSRLLICLSCCILFSCFLTFPWDHSIPFFLHSLFIIDTMEPSLNTPAVRKAFKATLWNFDVAIFQLITYVNRHTELSKLIFRNLSYFPKVPCSVSHLKIKRYEPSFKPCHWSGVRLWAKHLSSQFPHL